VAWKVLSGLQAGEGTAASAFPSGAYRVRFTHGVNAVTLGGQLAAQIAGGKYVLPYIEVESTYPFVDGQTGATDLIPRQSDEVWETKMIAFAAALASAGVEFIEFSNEPNRPTNVTNRYRLWDAYIDRLEKSAPIFRDAGVGVMLTALGPSQFNEEWMDYLAASGRVAQAIDAVAIHCYSGGTHAGGGAAGGMPSDSLQRMTDARAALDGAFPSRPELDFYVTELGWPTFWAASAAAQPGITDPGHQTYSTPAEQATRLSDVFALFYANAEANRCRMVGWFHSTDYRDGTTPDFAVLDADYTWPGSGTLLVDTVDGAPNEPNTLTNGTQVVNYTGVATDAPGGGPRFTGCTGGSGTWAAGTQLKWDTPGGWPHHHGIRYELGTPRVVSLGSNHKQSWAAFEADAGIGRNTAGAKPTVGSLGVDSLGPTTATLITSINPQGSATEWRLAWGRDKNLETYEAIHSAGSGSSAIPVNEVLSGLDPDTDYFCRFTAWNEKGMAWSSQIEQFSTPAVPEPEPPPVVVVSTAKPPLLSFSLVDHKQTKLASLVNRRAGSTGQIALNGQRSATVELAIEDPDAARLVEESALFLKVKLRKMPLFIGRVTLPVFTLGREDTSPLQVSALDPSYSLARNGIKLLKRTSANYEAPPVDGSGVPTAPARRGESYFLWAWRNHELEQSKQMAFLMETADASPDEKVRGILGHGIKRGTLEGNVIRERSDYSTGKNTWEAIGEIADLADGPDFELEPFDATNGDLCRLNTFYPAQGSDKRNDVRLEYGIGLNNVQTLTYQPSREDLCNRFIAVGKADRGGWATAIVAENVDSQERFGVLEDFGTFETKSIERLRARARAAVARRAFPVDFVDATILDEDEPGQLRFGPGGDDDFWLGDVVTVRAREPEGLDIAPVQRVTDATWTETQLATIEWTLTLVDSTLSPGITDFQTIGFIDPGE